MTTGKFVESVLEALEIGSWPKKVSFFQFSFNVILKNKVLSCLMSRVPSNFEVRVRTEDDRELLYNPFNISFE